MASLPAVETPIAGFSAAFNTAIPVKLEEFEAAGVHLELPRIIVVGDESAGKSSVLERVARAPVFPRHESCCTRMAIVLKLNNGPASDIIMRCTYYGRVLVDAAGVADETRIPFTTMSELENVTERIKDKMQYYNERANESSGMPKDSILTEHRIEIELHSPHVPDLELIDLPGLVQVCVCVCETIITDRANHIKRQHTRHCKDVIKGRLWPLFGRIRGRPPSRALKVNPLRLSPVCVCPSCAVARSDGDCIASAHAAIPCRP